MVGSIRHCCLWAGMVEPTEGSGALKTTKLGRLLFADKGLEPPRTPDTSPLYAYNSQITRHNAKGLSG